MIIKVKFNALSYRGKPVKFVEKIEVPDFTDFPYKWKIDRTGETVDCIETVKSQQQDYLLELDKSAFILKHDLLGIVDWEILEAKPSKLSHNKLIAIFAADAFKGDSKEQLQLDFMACYKKMAKDLKGLSVEKKITLVLASMNVAYQATLTAFMEYNEKVEKRLFSHRLENKDNNLLQ